MICDALETLHITKKVPYVCQFPTTATLAFGWESSALGTRAPSCVTNTRTCSKVGWHYHSRWRCGTHDLLAQNGMVVDPKAHPLWPPHLIILEASDVTRSVTLWLPLFSTLNQYILTSEHTETLKFIIYIYTT